MTWCRCESAQQSQERRGTQSTSPVQQQFPFPQFICNSIAYFKQQRHDDRRERSRLQALGSVRIP